MTGSEHISRGDPITPPGEDILRSIPLRFLVGTTASGKSGLALRLAEHPGLQKSLLGAQGGGGGLEIVSLDSMNIYRGMDIGTAKPSLEERGRVPHHLIDVADPSERFDLQAYQKLALEACRSIVSRGATPLFVGGTGLYLAALLRGLLEGPPADLELRERIMAESDSGAEPPLHERLQAIDPESAKRLHPNDVRRTLRALEVWVQTGKTMTSLQAQWRAEPSQREKSARIVGLEVPEELRDVRIRARIEAMLRGGWPEEALRLSEGAGLGVSAKQALGYDSALALAKGELKLEAATDLIVLRTRQFARRQRTWYRKFDIQWLDATGPDLAEQALAGLGLE